MLRLTSTTWRSLFLLLVAGPCCESLIHAADVSRTYRDREFGFSFNYPASWSEQPGIGQNTRVVITPASDLEANCNVIVRRVPITAHQTQADINRGLEGREFDYDYWLRDMPKNVRIFDARRVSLGSQMGRSAVLDFSIQIQGITAHTTQLHLITLTPGLFFGITCGSSGDTAEEARASFTYWKNTFAGIVSSFRVQETK